MPEKRTPSGILEKIVWYKKRALEAQKKKIPSDELQRRLAGRLDPPRFKSVILKPVTHLIAELKKASPSAGLIRRDFDCVRLARAYEAAGACAVSVLTEEHFFKGRLSFLADVAAAVSVPVLRKDFIIDEYQIDESKCHGADAVLLIASILSEKALAQLVRAARARRLDVLLEVHAAGDLRKALACGADVIGINTRRLDDFSFDLHVLPRLLEKIPRGMPVVAESGIRTLKDLAFVKSRRVNAVLVGEALMRAKDVFARTKEFVDFLKSA